MINCHDLENWYKKIILSFCLFTGGYQNFNVDPNTGWITIKTELDRDDASIQDSGGVYAMYVKVKQIRLIPWSTCIMIYFQNVCIHIIRFLLNEWKI